MARTERGREPYEPIDADARAAPEGLSALCEHCQTITMIVGANLTGDINEALRLQSSGQVVKAGGTGNMTVVISGGLAVEPGRNTAARDAVTLAVLGGAAVITMQAEAAIAAGNLLVPGSATAALLRLP